MASSPLIQDLLDSGSFTSLTVEVSTEEGLEATQKDDLNLVVPIGEVLLCLSMRKRSSVRNGWAKRTTSV